MMARNFKELEEKMPLASRRRGQAKSKRLLAELLLPELRRLSGMTQVDLARSLGIKQPTLSRLESKADMQISTLMRIVEALGGQLEIVIHLPSGDYCLGQFSPSSHLADPPGEYAAPKHRSPLRPD